MSTRKKYRVVRGISWYGDQRAEPGELRDDIPQKSIPWLLEQGHIEDPHAKKETTEEGKEADDGV